MDTRSATPVGWEPPGGGEGRGSSSPPPEGKRSGITERMKSKLAAALSISHLSISLPSYPPPTTTTTTSFRSRSLTEQAPPALSDGRAALSIDFFSLSSLRRGRKGPRPKSRIRRVSITGGDKTKTLQILLKESTLTRPGCPPTEANSHAVDCFPPAACAF